jgi:hypothetical protein
MKFSRFLISFLFVLLLSSNTYSIDTLVTKYFPLQVGNAWVYQKQVSITSTIIRSVITSESVINSHKYYLLENGPFLTSLVWIRIDSNSNNLLINGTGCPNNISEVMIDSLSAKKHDTALTCNSFQGNRFCADTGTYTIFNYQAPIKTFYGTALFASSRYYARNLGIYYSVYGEVVSTSYYLKGCIINGIVYGDTSLTGLITVSTEVPEKFMLFQNYPNPFNPSTKIKFDVPSTAETKLVIYNALGEETANLVNEKLKGGIYEVEWNADNFPSGIYYVRLFTPGFSETRKMVLLK